MSEDLLAVGPGRQLQRSGRLASTLLDAGVGGVVGDVRSLTRQFGAAQLPRAAASLTRTADELNRGTRLRRLLVRSTAVLGQARSLDLVPSVDRAADAVTGRLLPLVERGIAMLATTVELTRDTNRHAANLDRKFGGDLPLPGDRP